MKKILVVLTLMVFTLVAITGCASTKSTEEAGYYADSEVAEEPAYDEAIVSTEETTESESQSESASLNYDGSILEPDVERKIIYYGSFKIRTKNFDDDYDNLLATLQQLGGYVEQSSVSGTKPEDWRDSGRYASLTLRVPSDKFSEFTGQLDSFGETVSSSINGQDVSLDYYDTETHLTTLRTRETRLMALLEQAATLEDIIELENALADVSYEIQMLETNLRDYDSLIDYSTVTIEMQEVNQVEAVTLSEESVGTRISNAFYSVLNGLADFGEFLLVFFIGGAPILIILAGITVLIVVLVKRSKKKKLARLQNGNNQYPNR